MFGKLYNEAVIKFNMHTESPLFVGSGKNDQLDPTAADNTFLKLYRDGKLVPVLPGSSLKGVFRSTSEQLLEGSCDIFSHEYCGKKNNGKTGEEKYRASCPACKLFGSTALKSRISFKDAYPIGDIKTGYRSSVAIDRITGASKGTALYNFEYVEDGTFACEIRIKNFFRWHIKLLFDIFDRIDESYVTFGGSTSKGFGQMKVEEVSMNLRYYGRDKKAKGYEDRGFYIEKTIETRGEIAELLKDVSIDDKKALEESRFENDKAI